MKAPESPLAALADRVEALEGELDEARAAIAWANNSLFGSHGFFLSLNGGLADEHHLDRAIEELKSRARRSYQLETAISEIEKAIMRGDDAEAMGVIGELANRAHTGGQP